MDRYLVGGRVKTYQNFFIALALVVAMLGGCIPLAGWSPVYGQTPSAPAVTTNDASNITAYSTLLNGNLTALGSALTVNISFLWGTSSGNLTNETAPPEAKNTIGTFSFNLNTGLKPGTTYYYKAKAVGDGTSVGAEKSFTTLLIPVTINAPAQVNIGEEFVVRIENGTLQNLNACNYEISFDPTVLQIIDLVPGSPELNIGNGLINSTAIPVSFANVFHQGTGPGDPTLLAVTQNVPGLDGVSGSGYLAELRFKAIGSGNTNIGISNGALSDTLAQEILATWTGDSVHIPKPATFVVSELTISPAEVNIGENVNIGVRSLTMVTLKALTP